MAKLLSFLPVNRRARTMLLVLLFAGIIGGFSLTVPNKKTHLAAQKTPPTVLTGDNRFAADTDADGLKDWEEDIYGADHKKPDTDGDGTFDGEEIRLGRDPKKTGPNDFLIIAAALDVPEPIPQKNITNDLIQKIGEEYLLPMLENPNRRPDAKKLGNKLAEELLKETTAATPSFFGAADLVISSDNSIEAITSYARKFDAVALDSSRALGNTNMLATIIGALQKNNFQNLITAAPRAIAAYDSLLGRLKMLMVPSDISLLHLEYMNLAFEQRASIEQMARVDTDILRLVTGVQAYIATMERFQELSQKFQKEFRRRSITFQ